MASDSTPRPDESLDDDLAALIERERAPANRIQVSPHLRDPHPVIRRTQEAFEGASADRFGRLLFGSRGQQSAEIAVASGSVRRGLRLMNALFRALESRGHRVEAVGHPPHPDDCRSLVRCLVSGGEFRVCLTEKIRRIRPNERRPRRPGDMRTWQDFEPLGILELSIPCSYHGVVRTWRDGKRTRLEDRLSEVVIVMLEEAGPRRRRREEAARLRRETLEADGRREEQEQFRKIEAARVALLEASADRWHKAKRFAAFIEAVREEAIRRHGSLEATPDVARWIEWAEAHVRSIDPLASGQELPEIRESGDPRGSGPGSYQEGDRCPKCGFKYEWDGLECRHCHYSLGGR